MKALILTLAVLAPAVAVPLEPATQAAYKEDMQAGPFKYCIYDYLADEYIITIDGNEICPAVIDINLKMQRECI